ncbi:uncharacterized protein LOC135071343 [Ostrinia nubilalis]|uniref:uncharacterized protein LOC135071343 n=1 Tax=Ostrinia nubilalis TaxID=29057 RepID=UPI00308221BF
MATTGVGFRWLDILEKEFDKACVELDTSLTDLETEEPDIVFSARQKIATLSSCFAQLSHKSLTIFQNSAKLEAELVDMRAELVHARAASAGGCQDGGDGAGNVPEAARARSEAAQLARENAALRETVLALHSELFGARLATKYLDKELAGRIQQLQLLGRDMRSDIRDSLWAQVEAEILLQRHKTLVRVCRGVAPRPAAPAPPAPRPHRPRPRTVRVRRSPHLGLGISVTPRVYTAAASQDTSRVCRPHRPRPRTVRVRRSPHLGLGISVTVGITHHHPWFYLPHGVRTESRESARPRVYTAAAPQDTSRVCRPHRPRPRTVRVRRSPHLGLGISVTGGREHGVPILISELEAGGPAALTGELYVGDAILAINDVDLTQACHKEAVQALQSVKGDCALCVQFIATDDDDRLSEDNYRFPLYPEDGEVFGVEPDGSGATPTAPRTPDYNRRTSDARSASPSSEGRSPTRRYPDYNHINNNLAILDMDDDNIKIEARLEVSLEPGLSRGGYAAVGSSDSPHSTPVHKRGKKKRKPQDWRTKGAYRAVEPDAASSDEPLELPRERPRDIAIVDKAVGGSPVTAPLPAAPIIVPAPAMAPAPSVPAHMAPAHLSSAHLASAHLAPAQLAPSDPYGIHAHMTSSDMTPEHMSFVAPPVAPSSVAPAPVAPAPAVPATAAPTPLGSSVETPPPPAPEAPPDAEHKPTRTTNGDVKPQRRETKGFRIGSARRVTDAMAAAAAGGVVTNGDAERGKFPARLLAGDGDPDFGTPV